MTDAVYTYMLDEIQGEVLRARNRMEDVVKHLEAHKTTARFGAERARQLLESMREVTRGIDDLPALED